VRCRPARLMEHRRLCRSVYLALGLSRENWSSGAVSVQGKRFCRRSLLVSVLGGPRGGVWSRELWSAITAIRSPFSKEFLIGCVEVCHKRFTHGPCATFSLPLAELQKGSDGFANPRVGSSSISFSHRHGRCRSKTGVFMPWRVLPAC